MEPRKPVHGGLHIPDVPSVSENDYDAVIRKWGEATEWAAQEAARLLATHHRPAQIKGRDLMDLSKDEFAETHTVWVNWLGHVAKRLTDARLQQNRYDETADELDAKIRSINRQLSDKKQSIEELKDKVKLQPHRATIALELFKHESVKQLLQQEYEDAERKCALISRQVELRKENFEHSNRDGNVPRAVPPDYRYRRSPA